MLLRSVVVFRPGLMVLAEKRFNRATWDADRAADFAPHQLSAVKQPFHRASGEIQQRARLLDRQEQRFARHPFGLAWLGHAQDVLNFLQVRIDFRDVCLVFFAPETKFFEHLVPNLWRQKV
jgi:hypothetical protein